jgi:hypothetical protein
MADGVKRPAKRRYVRKGKSVVTQVLWLAVSYAFIGALAGVLLDSGWALGAAGVIILFPVLRIWRRFRPGRGYYLLSFFGEPGALRDWSIRATRQEYPALFKLMVVIEIAIVSIVCLVVISKSSFPFAAAFDEFRKCTLGTGMHEVCRG